MSDHKCEGDHKQHICALASEGKFQEIRRLARHPEYICHNCGRVADKKENLCDPMPLGE
jgi:hypothetical protein